MNVLLLLFCCCCFSQKLQFVFKHFTTVILIGVANVFCGQMIHMINCSEVFAKSSAFQELELCIFRSDMSSGTAETFLFWRTCIVIALLVKPDTCKTYLVIQTWMMV